MADISQRVAPKIDGYQADRLLGSGGFADVYLYRQEMPKREVAVKVLHDGVSANAAKVFTQEANVMAQLSAHPSIVTILHAAVALDGRPFLVMEFYPNPNLSIRYRKKPLAVDETLDIIIRIAGAVETAHRAGIIHRDIKPANILISAYGKPGLTDFGISAAKVDMEGTEGGLSIPWSAREVVLDPAVADERSDVYSLAATAFTLLAGFTPYEVPGGRNSAVDLVGRITSGRIPQLDRSDVPSSLRRALSMGLDPEASNRPSTAADFARMLQEVEVSLRLPVTALDLLDSGGEEVGDDDADVTRLRGAKVIRPHGGSESSDSVISGVPDRSAQKPQASAHPMGDIIEDFGPQNTVIRGAVHTPQPVRGNAERSAPPAGGSSSGAASSGASSTGEGSRNGRSRNVRALAVGAIAGLAIIVGVAGASVYNSMSTDQSAAAAPDEPAAEQDAIVLNVPAPVDLAIARTSTTTADATWGVEDPQPGDRFQWRRTDAGAQDQRGLADEPQLAITGLTEASRPCLEVWLVRNGIASEQPASTCMA